MNIADFHSKEYAVKVQPHSECWYIQRRKDGFETLLSAGSAGYSEYKQLRRAWRCSKRWFNELCAENTFEPPVKIDLAALKHEFRMDYKSDEWGRTMHWLFNICDIIHFERDIDVPEAWQYRPSPFGSSIDDDDSDAEFLRLADTETLLTFGNMLHRLCDLLTRTGKDY